MVQRETQQPSPSALGAFRREKEQLMSLRSLTCYAHAGVFVVLTNESLGEGELEAGEFLQDP